MIPMHLRYRLTLLKVLKVSTNSFPEDLFLSLTKLALWTMNVTNMNDIHAHSFSALPGRQLKICLTSFLTVSPAFFHLLRGILDKIPLALQIQYAPNQNHDFHP